MPVAARVIDSGDPTQKTREMCEVVPELDGLVRWSTEDNPHRFDIVGERPDIDLRPSLRSEVEAFCEVDVPVEACREVDLLAEGTLDVIEQPAHHGTQLDNRESRHIGHAEIIRHEYPSRTPILNDVTVEALSHGAEPNNPQAWYDLADQLADLGGPGNAARAEALLRAAVDAGHSRALIRLAELLAYQNDRPSAHSAAQAQSLLLRAVDADVPEAANALALLLADNGEPERAEAYFRQGIASGDLNAATNLADLLHERGADVEAFDVLRHAAEAGDDLAYQIIERNIDNASQAWRDITASFFAARLPNTPRSFYCIGADEWRLTGLTSHDASTA
ncbi:hypothetical protein [Micromonospora luteifusca]|uniref:hypothetical protein n=1 Tax=Micromonospora luteifusca TaxID=709860 RepID=UPI0033AD4C4E